MPIPVISSFLKKSGTFRFEKERSVLFITLDSCRYDTFENAETPNLSGVGRLYRAMAPGNFTYGSHAAMFVGFTPGIAGRREAFINPKYGKIFKLVGAGYPGKGTEHLVLEGKNIIEGFKNKGYLTLGSGAVGWFDPHSRTGQLLAGDFDKIYFPADTHSLAKQLDWLQHALVDPSRPVFAFLNIGETHVPYYYDGAPWNCDVNPCVPFSDKNDAAECRRRQKACVEYIDHLLKPLLEAFRAATTVICSDHGDCWGEDGLWEHGIHHEKVLEVPLIFRLNSGQ
jgi:membrane-anchored protein YejM (alkaline phosphatase superfamily)